jgi:hypothetical protein
MNIKAKYLRFILSLVFLVLSSMVLSPNVSAQLSSASLSVSPSSVTIQNGSLSTLDIRISNAIRLGGYEFVVKYNPAVVRVDSASDVTLGTFLASTGRTATLLSPSINNTTGRVSLGAFSFGSQTGPSGSGSLALVRFRAVGPGTSTITIENALLSTSDATPQTQPSTVSAGSITVQAPATGTPTPIRTGTPTPIPSATRTPTPISTSTRTPTPVRTVTPTLTPIVTSTGTRTPTPSRTGTPTLTPTGRITNAPTATNTQAPTNTRVPSTTNSPTPVPLPADCDNNSVVDGIDFVCWLNHYGQSVSGVSNGDYNNSGFVDGVDYTIWLFNYGRR